MNKEQMLTSLADFVEQHTHNIIASSFGTSISLLLPFESWILKALSAVTIAALCWVTTNILTWLKNKFSSKNK